MDVGPFFREVDYEYAGEIFRDTVAMNFQQSSSRPFFIFQQFTAALTINGEDLIFGQFSQKALRYLQAIAQCHK